MVSIQLVSHSSVIIRAGTATILCDPWLHGKAFNESWSLLVPAAITPEELERVNYLWISHEHPDHFHIPSLRSLPDAFKRRVTVLFKTDFSDKMPAAFRRLGFEKLTLLPHREKVEIEKDVTVYCLHSRVMDSALAVITPGFTVLNANDAELTEGDCQTIVKDVGRTHVVLNQFGIAGFSGQADYAEALARLKRQKIANMIDRHRWLQADASIPFASFVYFSCTDNRFINDYLSTPRDVVKAFQQADARTDVLFPGDTWTAGQPHDSEPALRRFDEVYRNTAALPYDEPVRVDLETLRKAHGEMVALLYQQYPAWMIRRFPAVTVQIEDLGVRIRFRLEPGAFELGDPADEPTLIVNSQPLHFAFTNPFGFQTLGVSGRYRLGKNLESWRYYRVLFSIRNAQIYLRADQILRRGFLSYLWSRRQGLPQQALDRWRTMFV